MQDVAAVDFNILRFHLIRSIITFYWSWKTNKVTSLAGYDVTQGDTRLSQYLIYDAVNEAKGFDCGLLNLFNASSNKSVLGATCTKTK